MDGWSCCNRFGLRVGLKVALGGAVLAAGCVSSGGGVSDWSRSYAHPFDRVWEGVLEVLADGGYLVDDADREEGRIRAESGDDRPHRSTLLVLTVRSRGELVTVDVEARAGTMAPGDQRQAEIAVVEILGALDVKLKS